MGLNLNMDIYEIRRLNARALAGSVGGATEFGEKTDKAQSIISRWIGRTKNPKNIGQMAAREIEIAFEKPRGWMDQSNINLWEKFGLAYSAAERGEPSPEDVRGLSWESIRIARLIERTPPEKLNAILTLLDAKEELPKPEQISPPPRPLNRRGKTPERS